MRFNLRLRTDRPFDVVGMGLNSVDFLNVVSEFPTLNSKREILSFSKQGGGQVATALVALSRWGVKTKYVGKIGSDDLGAFALETIRQEGVDVSSVVTEPQATNQFAMIIVDGVSGERTILWNRDKRLMYRDGELRKEEICCGRLLHLDGHDLPAAIRCARWARDEGIPTVVDLDKVEPLTSELIQQTDFVVTSSRFPGLFTGISDREKALVEIQKQIPGFLCSTLGHEGAVALVEGNFLYVKGLEVKVIDTTGAGDVFHGGFLYGLLQNWEPDKILRFASAAASLKCRDLGGRRGIPPLEEVVAWIHSDA